MSTDPLSTSYDLVPYSSTAVPQSHPDRLATVARLFGVEAASPERCRVLELGAASGGNLIPMAWDLPLSEFVGVDFSSRQIAQGQSTIQALGLKNIELRYLSIADIGEDFGRFDYIICHGVYSWVPDAIREHIFRVCREHLAPQGIAYVSYNAYPGWYTRGMIRDILRYHAARFSEPQVQIDQARWLLNFLATNVSGDSPYGVTLRRELEGIQGERDYYLFHEHLEEVNSAVYFFQFAAQLAEHGLQYLGEADVSTMLPTNYPPNVAEVLRRIAPDIIYMEQYMDFLSNRTFRETLVVHREQVLRRNLTSAHVKPFFIASQAKPVSASPEIRSNAPEVFRVPSGLALRTSHPMTKAAMMVMAERWPETLPFSDLCAAARSKLEPGSHPKGSPGNEALEILQRELFSAYTGGMVELRPRRLRCTREIAPRPQASQLARHQARADAKGRVVNLRHETVVLDELKRQVLMRLDGQHDRNMLLNELFDLVRTGGANLEQNGKPVSDPAELRSLLEQLLDEDLSTLASLALLT